MLRTLLSLLILAGASLACNAPGAASTAAAQPTAGPTSAGATAVVSSSPPAATGAVAEGNCGAGDVKSGVLAASAAQSSADSYRVSGKVTTQTVLEAVMEIQKPDRIHVKAGDLEFIAIGSTTWQRAGGTWREAPNVDVASLVGGMGQLDQELITTASFTNTSASQTVVDGAPAIEFAYHESIPGELEADVHLWVDPATCRPIRNVAQSTASSRSATYDVTFSDWNAVTVEAPV